MSNAQRLAARGLMDLSQVARPLPKEGEPAAPVKVAKMARPARSYRVSTRISEDIGQRFERLIAEARTKEGRHMRGSDIIERAILALERELDGMAP